MSRKDYVAMARAFAEALDDCRSDDRGRQGVWTAARRMAVLCVKDNANFKPETFFQAILDQHDLVKAERLWG